MSKYDTCYNTFCIHYTPSYRRKHRCINERKIENKNKDKTRDSSEVKHNKKYNIKPKDKQSKELKEFEKNKEVVKS
jgi:hypothetical protein